MSSLYLHIPFCLKKCHYCSFTSTTATKSEQESYLSALKQEISKISREFLPLKTIFIGGGTPTSLTSGALCDLVEFITGHFKIAQSAEISVESNPGTVDKKYLDMLLNAGVNRLSLGIQSFDDRQLNNLGRLHDKKQAIDAVIWAKQAGFENLNIDLMYGLPDQDQESWKRSLEYAISLSPQHLSLYQLTVEEGTHYWRLSASGKLNLPGEDEVLRMDEITSIISRENQFHQYEISNFSLQGYECRHNINYWENNDYLAAGAAAVSFIGGVREKRVSDYKNYTRRVQQGDSAVVERECLTREESFRETVIMGLRMVRGVSLTSLWKKYRMDPADHYGTTLTTLLDRGLVELTSTHLRLTDKGAPLSNTIMAELV